MMIVDDERLRTLAREAVENSELTLTQVAGRVGFSRMAVSYALGRGETPRRATRYGCTNAAIVRALTDYDVQENDRWRID